MTPIPHAPAEKEVTMHARVWQLRILPGKTEDFKAAVKAVSGLARKQQGYRGVLALGSEKEGTWEATVIAFWDSLEAIRESERNLFLMQALARVFSCSDGLPHIVEQPVLTSDFRGART
jgi:antibiotic biosynthesis monooxygenase (ABM) superfamily enzyme